MSSVVAFLPLVCLKQSFEKFLALNLTSFRMHAGLKREISIQKAGELAKEWRNGSGLHLVAVIIELILPKHFSLPLRLALRQLSL